MSSNGIIKVIGLVVSMIKLVLNVKKWITMPYRVVMYIHDHPMKSAIWVCLAVLGGIYLYHTSV